MLSLHRYVLPHALRHFCNRLVGRYRPPKALPPNYAALAKSAAEYAISLTRAYLNHRIPGALGSVAGKRILELGPGQDFTPALVLAGYGAQMTLADLYLEEWNPKYHPLFYREVRRQIMESHREWPVAAIDDVIDRNDHRGGPLRTLHCGLERLDGVPDQSFDLTVSNAVFEHLYDVPRAMRELYRVTAAGGLGSHQVDFRDHRDFSRPLEFLADSAYVRTKDKVSTDHGTPLRPHEFERILIEAGFQVEMFYPNSFADPAYLADVRPRLLRQYRHLTEEQLRPIGGRFVLVRPT